MGISAEVIEKTMRDMERVITELRNKITELEELEKELK